MKDIEKKDMFDDVFVSAALTPTCKDCVWRDFTTLSPVRIMKCGAQGYRECSDAYISEICCLVYTSNNEVLVAKESL